MTQRVCCLHDGVDSAAIALPHGAEPRLAADVPQLDGHVAFGDLPHVEADSRNHVLTELTRLKKEKSLANSSSPRTQQPAVLS